MDKSEAVCPFCPGLEKENGELYRTADKDDNWKVLVIPNKFPFTPNHEIIIHSPDHHKNFDELPFSQVELILKTYRERFLANQNNGQVYIFHNRGRAAGESLPHPHSQLTVVPKEFTLDVPLLERVVKLDPRNLKLDNEVRPWRLENLTSFFKFPHRTSHIKHQTSKLETEHFFLSCPPTSDWPDEVWIAPRKSGERYGDIIDAQITDLAHALTRIIQIFDLRHGHEFPFNFYIYPGKNWYLRLIPRIKILGGFELGTKVMVNTQEPEQTMAFLKEHFWEPDAEKIRNSHKADYVRGV